MLGALPFVLAARLLSFLPFGLYKGWWRHAGVDDLVAVIKSVSMGSGIMLAALLLAGGVERLPRSILVLDWGICIALLGGSRLAARGTRDWWMAMRWRHGASKRTLVIGAGDAAERLLRELQRGGFEKLRPVGIVDDDPAKRGMQLRGVPVLGASDAIPRLVARHRVEVIVIAVPSASCEEMQRLVDACVHAQVEFRIAPSLRELLEGRVQRDRRCLLYTSPSWFARWRRWGRGGWCCWTGPKAPCRSCTWTWPVATRSWSWCRWWVT
jgi:FlaA1/EpsC-like NDP-sugar epimerase